MDKNLAKKFLLCRQPCVSAALGKGHQMPTDRVLKEASRRLQVSSLYYLVACHLNQWNVLYKPVPDLLKNIQLSWDEKTSARLID